MVNRRPLAALSVVLMVSGAFILAVQHNPHLRLSLGLGANPFHTGQVVKGAPRRIPADSFSAFPDVTSGSQVRTPVSPIHTSSETRVVESEPDPVPQSEADFIRLISPEDSHKQGWFVPAPDTEGMKTSPHIVAPPAMVEPPAGNGRRGDDVFMAAEPATVTEATPGVSPSHPVEPQVVSHLTHPIPLIETGNSPASERVEADVRAEDDEEESFENTMTSILRKLKKHLKDDEAQGQQQQQQQQKKQQERPVPFREKPSARGSPSQTPSSVHKAGAKRRWSEDDDEDEDEDEEEEAYATRGRKNHGKRKHGEKVVVHHHHHHYHGGNGAVDSAAQQQAEREVEKEADAAPGSKHAHVHDHQQAERARSVEPETQRAADDELVGHPADIFSHPFFSNIHSAFGDQPFASPESHPGFRVIRYVPHQGYPPQQ